MLVDQVLYSWCLYSSYIPRTLTDDSAAPIPGLTHKCRVLILYIQTSHFLEIIWRELYIILLLIFE